MSSQVHILVVDDLEANLFSMQRMLMPLNARVSTASSAAEGLRLLLHEKVDVIVLDYSMPGINGLEMAKLVNQQFIEPPPILFVTAHGHNVPGLENSCYELGAMDFIEKPVREEALLAKLKVLITLTEQKEEMRRLASIDPVTQIKNRLAFQEAMRQNVSLAKRQERMMAILALDVDDFKSVNDTYGHAAGDELLQGFAQRIAMSVREADVAARIGGDEFAILLTNLKEQSDVDTVCNKILKACKVPVQYGEHSIEIKTSIGAALFPFHGDDEEGLMKAADVALYQAKASGKGKTVVLQGGFGALNGDEDMKQLMQIAYQPMFASAGRTPVGSEILAKIANSEQYGGTEAVIRHFRQLGHGDMFEHTLQQQVAEDFAQLSVSAKDGAFYLFLNELMADLSDSAHLTSLCQLQQNLSAHNVQLVLDLPDWDRYGYRDGILAACKRLHENGVKLCLQDIGEQVIPNNLMAVLPVDFIKLSLNLVHAVVEDEYAKKTVISAIEIAKSVGCQPIALGVETASQYALLKQLGCSYFQGSYWAMPISLADLKQRWLSDNIVQFDEARKPSA
ncbi:MAG: diguanylate cyclase [Oleiphilaceae bacterium]|nr:diguanylate cyclase [Oleiphilaceae bacterium]